MVEAILGAFSLTVILVIVYYNGELVARERAKLVEVEQSIAELQAQAKRFEAL